MTFIVAMILHPGVQEKVQAELDMVLGEERLPELSDRESLPYTNCVLKEAARWSPVAPLGLAHACSQANEYRGFGIPKGAIVIGNVWAISNDPSVYPEPRKFNPDRFFNPSVPEAPGFGFGRRFCPGVYFAESSLFIAATTLLTIFNITSTPGKPTPEAKWTADSLVASETQASISIFLYPHPKI
ncbi:hypothetical protein FRC06_002581 [Ceratobasidium sp. 370]|nr:hypothetical protein FRC06_002581 [Ceratobasidium sp. 370]